MQIFLLLILLMSCRTPPQQKVNNNVLHFIEVKSDAKIVGKLTLLKQQLSELEQQTLTKDYVHFYRYALGETCGFNETLDPGPRLPRLGIPPLIFLDINRRRKLDENFLTISTELGDSQYYYFGESSDSANEMFFNLKPLPKLKRNKHGFELLLLRAGTPTQRKFIICAIHYAQENVCVEDFLIKELEDINKQDEFCSWLASSPSFSSEQSTEISFKLLQILNAIDLVKVKNN